jgi:hypothetical protein
VRDIINRFGFNGKQRGKCNGYFIVNFEALLHQSMHPVKAFVAYFSLRWSVINRAVAYFTPSQCFPVSRLSPHLTHHVDSRLHGYYTYADITYFYYIKRIAH